ncbi:hypothetical protein [Streptomyces broussonetiae]|uniref:Uncharacterized protein n=1 Tax=Streptomyces broussonetiae TaxID=2686304 RepID=A0ABV5EJ64_9ACTN
MASGLALPYVTSATTSVTRQAPGEAGSRPQAAAKPVRWAADAVATMREGARVRLDYTAQSLWRVDRMIDELRQEGTPAAAVESVLRGFGAYAGEVIVRQTGAEWWVSGGDHWVRTPDGRLWDPVEEATRCFTGDGSLRLLCRDATAGGRG